MLMTASSPVRNPFNWQRVGSDDSVEFYGYGGLLVPDNVTEVLNNATSEAFTHPADTLISRESLQFRVGDVQLFLVPRPELTWRLWSTALWGMRLSVKRQKMYFEWSFMIFRSEAIDEGELGYGILQGVTVSSGEINTGLATSK